MPSGQFTIRRMLGEVRYLGLLIAPIGCAARTPPGADGQGTGTRLLLATGWVVLLLLTRVAYKNLPTPFR